MFTLCLGTIVQTVYDHTVSIREDSSNLNVYLPMNTAMRRCLYMLYWFNDAGSHRMRDMFW